MDGVYTLQQVFTHRLFSVPDYQRGYSWETVHRRDLLADLDLLVPGNFHHYAGTLVLHAVPDRPKVRDSRGGAHVRFDVVDGQQRLTTVVTLLNAIQRRLAESEDHSELAAGIRDSYVSTNDRDGRPLYRLQLNRDCQEFWRERVVAQQPGPLPPTIESHRRLLAARDEFAAHVDEVFARPDGGGRRSLLEMYEKLTEQLVFSVYEVGRTAEVGVIFEVMNNRGKPLSELEKVKNFLLYLACRPGLDGRGLDDAINRTWTDVFERLAAAGLGATSQEDQLLRLHWILAYDHDTRHWHGARSIKDRFDPWDWRGREAELLGELHAYVDSLRDVTIAFCDAQSPLHSGAFAGWAPAAREAARHWASKLHRLRIVAPFLPVLAAVRVRAADEPEQYVRFLKACELFAFRAYRLANRRSNAGHSSFRWAGRKLWLGGDPDVWLRQMGSWTVGYSPQSEVDARLDAVGNWYGWNGLRYLLYEYEEHLAGRNGTRLSWAEIERRDLDKCIEHVLPQTATNSYWRERFTNTDREELTHDLGNLVLSTVEANPAYSNRPFPDKKGSPGLGRACYADAVLFQERELAQLDDWTPDQVDGRHARITDWARERWPLPASAGPAEGPEGDEGPVGEDFDEQEL